MTVVAQIRINGVPNNLLNNYLSVYFQGQIRCYATPIKINGQALYFLNLYSNTYKDESLDIEAFIGSNGKVYEATAPVIFKHHKALGNILQPLQIDLELSQRPLIYSLSEIDYAEGSCPQVLDVQTSDNADAEGGALTYSITGGADAARFVINSITGVLQWAPGFVPDYEMPADANTDNTDANTDNVYLVAVTANDGAGGITVQNLSVTVTPVNDNSPVINSNGGGASASVSRGSSQSVAAPASESEHVLSANGGIRIFNLRGQCNCLIVAY